MPPIVGANQKNMQTLMRAAEKLNNPTLSSKIRSLQSKKSSDPLQQLQTDAIVDLFEAVKQIQEAIWPMLAVIPDVSAVRDAAAQAGAGSVSNAAPLASSPTNLLKNVKLR